MLWITRYPSKHKVIKNFYLFCYYIVYYYLLYFVNSTPFGVIILFIFYIFKKSDWVLARQILVAVAPAATSIGIYPF